MIMSGKPLTIAINCIAINTVQFIWRISWKPLILEPTIAELYGNFSNSIFNINCNGTCITYFLYFEPIEVNVCELLQ